MLDLNIIMCTIGKICTDGTAFDLYVFINDKKQTVYVFTTWLNFVLSIFLPPHRFLRERRACSKSLVSRATQTIVSAWAPAAVARIRARNCADH